MASTFAPTLLVGHAVRLVPLSVDHLDALWEAGSDENLWTWHPSPVRSREAMQGYVETALRMQAEGTALPFTTMLPAGQVIGSTRFFEYEPAHRHLEIGSTWITRPWQRTAVNTEAKYLMLRHAFEELGCLRVQLRTDVLNQRSRNAILRLGAKEEGVFRKHWVTTSGRIRDSIFFSIVDSEWPEVKARLEAKLGR